MAWDDSARWIDIAFQRDPHSVETSMEAGLLSERHGALAAAAAHYARAVDLNPGNDAAWAGLARIHLSAGDAEAAVEAIDNALSGSSQERVITALGSLMPAPWSPQVGPPLDPAVREGALVLARSRTESVAAAQALLEQAVDAPAGHPVHETLRRWLDAQAARPRRLSIRRMHPIPEPPRIPSPTSGARPDLAAGLVRNALAGAGRNVVGAVVALAVTPYALRTLGPERFGVWAVAGAVLTSMQLVDLGLERSLTRTIARLKPRTGQEEDVHGAAVGPWSGEGAVAVATARALLGGRLLEWRRPDRADTRSDRRRHLRRSRPFESRGGSGGSGNGRRGGRQPPRLTLEGRPRRRGANGSHARSGERPTPGIRAGRVLVLWLGGAYPAWWPRTWCWPW
jgi:hypothetical protein